MDKKNFNDKDFEYTIVMDASYIGPDVNDFRKPEEGRTSCRTRIRSAYGGRYDKSIKRRIWIFPI